jgi:hypothetical protein
MADDPGPSRAGYIRQRPKRPRTHKPDRAVPISGKAVGQQPTAARDSKRRGASRLRASTVPVTVAVHSIWCSRRPGVAFDNGSDSYVRAVRRSVVTAAACDKCCANRECQRVPYAFSIRAFVSSIQPPAALAIFGVRIPRSFAPSSEHYLSPVAKDCSSAASCPNRSRSGQLLNLRAAHPLRSPELGRQNSLSHQAALRRHRRFANRCVWCRYRWVRAWGLRHLGGPHHMALFSVV